MAKESGLGDQLYVAGYDLSGDIGSVSHIGSPKTLIEVTGINKSAFERVPALKDGEISFASYWNPSSNQAHDRLSILPTTDVIVSYFHGSTLGNDCASIVAKQVNYDGTRNKDSSFTFETQALANGYGLEWGNMVTAGIRQDVTATSPATGVDFLASTSFGWQAYLHVFAFTGTSVTITLQDSANNSSFAGFTGSAFSTVTGITSERLQASSGTATVRQYVRVITSGTFSVANFAVMFVKNQGTVTF